MSTQSCMSRIREERRSLRGNRPKLTDSQLARLPQLRAEGVSMKDLAERFGVSITTICQALAPERRHRTPVSRVEG